MLFSRILESYRKSKERRNIVLSMINWLRIDHAQKKLFIDSIEVLDDEWLESMYSRIMQFVSSEESERLVNSWKTNSRMVSNLRAKEMGEKRREMDSFNLLLDNI